MALSLFTGRLEVLWVLVGEMVYVYYVVLRFKKGLPRLLALLPVLPPSLLVPWRAETGPERTLYCFLFLWTIMSKLLLLVWDMGPAADPHTISTFPRFFSAVTFSLHLKRNKRFLSSTQFAPATAVAAADSGPPEDDDDGEESTRRRNGSSYSEAPNGLRGRRKPKAPPQPGIGEEKSSESNGVQAQELLQKRPAGKKGARFSCPRWMEVVVNSQAGGIVVLRSVFYFVVAACLIGTVQEGRPVLPIYVLDFLLGFVMYFSCLFLFDSAAGVSACLLGTQLHPQFNLPFLADSLADFWGRRWNLLVNNLLRVSVYEPMLSYLIGKEEEEEGGGGEKQKRRKGTPRDRAIATGAAFLVSGLMHEIIFFYMNRTRPTGEMTAFFLVNGAATIAEGLVKPRERLGMPRLLRWAYTVSFVYVTACWLFFPPIFRTGMVDQCLSDLHTFTSWVRGMTVGCPVHWK